MLRECVPKKRVLRPRWVLSGVAVMLGGCTLVPPDQTMQPEPRQTATEPAPPPFVSQPAVDSEPQLVSMKEPDYPASAREAKLEGIVFCDVLVDKTGAVREVRVARGVGPLLDDVASAAARTGSFKPALKHGAPVDYWVRVPVEFRLHN